MTTTTADPTAPVAAVRAAFAAWLVDHAADLDPFRTKLPHDIDEAWEQQRGCMRLLWDDGWTRLGWPVDCGGLGGSALLHAAVLEDLAAAGYVIPEFVSTTEIIAPMLVRFAPHLAATDVAPGIRGEHGWSQGFSEPDAGSDLGSLRTRAVPDGDGWRISGQKMWSSLAHVADRYCLLARTGAPDSGYRGLTMFWVDLRSPGISCVPTACASDRHETAEVFLDDVFVPGDRVVGDVGAGWKVAMYLLQFERGGYAWQRQADLHTMLRAIVADAPRPLAANAPELVGSTYLSLLGLRSLAADVVTRLAAGEELGPETSVGKVLLGLTEQHVTDLARTLLWPALEVDDDDDAEMWRRRWSYARVTTVFGGTAEVQRDLIAERLLGLPGALMGRVTTVFGGTAEVQVGDLIAERLLGLPRGR